MIAKGDQTFMSTKQLFWIITLILVGAFVAAACSPSPPSAPAAEAASDDDHAAETDHHDDEHAAEADDHDEHAHSPEDHMAGMHHDVPEEAAAVPNPIEANNESIARGGELFATNCAICHGESGEGDGPAATELEKKPADLHEAHVQELSDGALFYIISHGKPDTPMPAWGNVLKEEERWQVINFLRTFNDE
jgi:mono/diheme cytochrome c family protein